MSAMSNTFFSPCKIKFRITLCEPWCFRKPDKWGEKIFSIASLIWSTSITSNQIREDQRGEMLLLWSDRSPYATQTAQCKRNNAKVAVSGTTSQVCTEKNQREHGQRKWLHIKKTSEGTEKDDTTSDREFLQQTVKHLVSSKALHDL